MVQQKQKTTVKKSKTRASVSSRSGYEKVFESDGTYLLKLVSFVLLGMLWLRFSDPVIWLGMPLGGIPIGLFIGLLLVRQFEKYQEDRRIWYAILIVVTIISNFTPAGIVI